MFLIVFVTLMISIIGLYAQVLGLQAKKIYNAQVGLMQTMVTWHGAALGLASNAANAALISAQPSDTGCSVTPGLAAPCAFTLSGANLSYLPSNYTYSFYSIAYQIAGTPYVITFAHDTNSPTYSTPYADPTKNLLLPTHNGGTEVGYSFNALTQQFARSAPANLVYGTVTSTGVLTVVPNATGAVTGNLPYTIPAVIPVGSLAIISVAH